MDNEDVSVTLYDVHWMASLIECPEPIPCANKPDLELFLGFKTEDHWKLFPAKIMIGNGITFTTIISLDFQRNKDRAYLVLRMRVQQKLFV